MSSSSVPLVLRTAPAYAAGSALAGLDQQIAALVAERLRQSGDAEAVPPADLVAAWAAQLGLEADVLASVFQALASAPRRARLLQRVARFVRLDDEEPLRVVGLFLHARFGGARADATHMVQYPSGSEVEVRLRPLRPVEGVHVRVDADLAVTADDATAYRVTWHGTQSEHDGVRARFVVSPPLPDDLAGVRLELVRAERMERVPRFRTLAPRTPVALRPRRPR